MTLLFSSALFLSAALLMFVEPMFAKMVLPRLGGTPAVWNTCVVFFQVTLLAGYGYAHLTTRWLAPRTQALLHLTLLLLAMAFLPIGLDAARQPSATGSPMFWLVGTLGTAVGLPFFAVSASAPLLQKWFAATDHRHAVDPYFLYSSSNLGSLGALVLYPFVVEPMFTLAGQSSSWTIGYIGLVSLIAACGWRVWRARAAPIVAPLGLVPPQEPLSWSRRLLWVALAAVPSSLMLSVTTYVATDVAAVPLLWMVPLGLYLGTFVLMFARRPIIPVVWMSNLLPILVLLPALTMLMRSTPPLTAIPLHFLVFAAIAIVCHGRLARLRPSVDHLTEFYLWMSIGGAMGGLFNTLLAPAIFKTTLEYPIGLVAACLLRIPPGRPRRSPVILEGSPGTRRRSLVWGAAWNFVVPAAAFGLTWALLSLPGRLQREDADWMALGRTFALPLAVALLCWRRPVAFALTFGMVLLAQHSYNEYRFPPVFVQRTFFGQHRVVDRGDFRFLINGTTSHGSQAHAEASRCEPSSYFARSSPVGQVFGTFVGAQARRRIGIVGLGTGTMAAYAQPGQTWTFFEINPAVRDIAESEKYFTYLRDCVRDYSIVIGDGRLSLGRMPDQTFDALVFDAFSSDAIPVHMVTLEAMQLDLRKLALHGVMLFHTSNRYLDLQPVLGAIASHLSLAARVQSDLVISPQVQQRGGVPSTWVVVARSEDDLGAVIHDDRWVRLPADSSSPLWTDDYSNIERIIRW